MSEEISSVPAEDLPQLLDLVIWDTKPIVTSRQVVEIMKRLSLRPDAESDGVRRALAVCREYLAKPGSGEEAAAATEAWPDLVPSKRTR